jgi:GTPase
MTRLRRFIDSTTIIIKGGHGGNGCVSFQKLSKFGPPNGGNGGRGGNVLFSATNIDCLSHLERVYKIENGRSGGGSGMKGEDGNDIILPVPVGTIVTELVTEAPLESPSTSMEDRFYDHFLVKSGYVPQGDRIRHWVTQIPYRPKKSPIQLEILQENVMIRKGGLGGFGNTHYTAPQIQSPQIAGRGERKGDMVLRVELKLSSDVAIIGFGSKHLLGLITNVNQTRNEESVYEYYNHLKETPLLGVIQYQDHLTIRTVALPFTKPQHLEKTKLIIGAIDLRLEIDAQLKELDTLGETIDGGLDNTYQLVVVDGIELKGSKELVERICETVKVPVLPVSSKHEKNGLLLQEWIRNYIENKM